MISLIYTLGIILAGILYFAFLCVFIPFYSFKKVVKWIFRKYAPYMDNILLKICIGPIVYLIIFLMAVIIYVVGFIYWFGKYSLKFTGSFFPSD
jgi:hypothetical protein